MSTFQGAQVNKISGQNRVAPTDDSVILLVFREGLVLPSGILTNVPVKLIQYSDANNYGINEAYDVNNNIVVNYHIQEFFRLCPNGTLWILFQKDVDLFIQPSGVPLTSFWKEEKIKGIGFCYNSPAVKLQDVFDYAIDIWQTWVDTKRSENILIDFVIVEGPQSPQVPQTPIADYPDLRDKVAPNVSVVIGSDTNHRAPISYAAVGSVLGMLGIRTISENLGSVDIQNKPKKLQGQNKYSLTDKANGLWLSASISNGRKFSELTEQEIETLGEDKNGLGYGYIFAGTYQDFEGFYFNDSYTAVSRANDYNRIENNRIWNAAARGIRVALIPKQNSILKIDPLTGELRGETVKSLETYGQRVLDELERQGHIAGGKFFIAQDQSPNDVTPLFVEASYVKNGILYNIQINLGPTTSLS